MFKFYFFFKVNETSLEDVGHEEAVNIIKQSCDPVKFTVLRQIPGPPSAKTDEARDSSATILSIKTVCESEDKETNTVACQTDPFLTFLSTSELVQLPVSISEQTRVGLKV